MPSLREHILKKIDPKEYFDDQIAQISWRGESDVTVVCPFHQDSSPSFTISPTSGAFYCHGCNTRGNSIISFHCQLYDMEPQKTILQLYDEYVRPIIHRREIRKNKAKLKRTPTAKKYLKTRMISESVIREEKLGFTGRHIFIPIFNEFGICINAKMVDPLAKKRGGEKMYNYKRRGEPRSFGASPILYPMHVLLENDDLFICEGEWDTLALLSQGVPAITGTSGSESWPSEYNMYFRGKKVTFVYDNDDAGNRGREKAARNLEGTATEIRFLDVPQEVGKDVTDWIRDREDMRFPEAWQEVQNDARTVSKGSEGGKSPSEPLLSLSGASEAHHFGTELEIPALVAGKATAPYILPESYEINCRGDCEDCPVSFSGGKLEKTIDPEDPDILGLIDVPKSSIRSVLLGKAGVPKSSGRCDGDIKIKSMFNVEHLVLTPTLDSSGPYVMRSGYLVGHGTIPNRPYNFTGLSVPHPKDQRVVHFLHKKKPLQTEIESFHMTTEVKKELEVFRPNNLNLMAHLMNMAEWQSRHITKIKERPDLHIAVDLVFHSVPSFYFNNEYIHRGMLDALIIGDTRCGKGYVTERLAKFYGVGEVASGENCTFAGLVGGLQQVGKQWIVTWGLIPLNNERLVVIDEASALSEEEFGHMSRVRSEGVAEISKIVKEQTQANTRLIWLSNPRSGKPLRSYNTGVEAIKELIKNSEDISRFDFALSVATDEVSSEIINMIQDKEDLEDKGRFPNHLCRQLIIWAWSRSPDQVVFRKRAVNDILKESIEFGKRYSSEIPLVQGENIRVKISKIAAAAAARTFSTDKSGEKVIVTPNHVRFAVSFLRMIYGKASMGYDLFSRTSAAASVIVDKREVKKTLETITQNPEVLLSGLLEMHHITKQNLTDFLGDPTLAQILITKLIGLRCLVQEGNAYIKNPRFTTLLKNMRRKNNERDRI